MWTTVRLQNFLTSAIITLPEIGIFASSAQKITFTNDASSFSIWGDSNSFLRGSRWKFG